MPAPSGGSWFGWLLDETRLKTWLLILTAGGATIALLKKAGVTGFLSNWFYDPIATRISDRVDAQLVERVRPGLKKEFEQLADVVRHSEQIPVLTASVERIEQALKDGEHKFADMGQSFRDMSTSNGLILELLESQNRAHVTLREDTNELQEKAGILHTHMRKTDAKVPGGQRPDDD